LSVTENQHEKQLAQRTLTKSLLYQFSVMDTRADGSRTVASNSLLYMHYKSKADLRPREAMSTELPLLVKCCTVVLWAEHQNSPTGV